EDAHVRSAAARALADFPNSGVTFKLGRIASDEAAPLAQRLGAIDALASNIHRRQVVAQLISLLGSDVPEVTARAYAALARAARRPIASSRDAWKAWWMGKSKLDDKAWLNDRLGLLHAHMRSLEDQAARERSVAVRAHASLAARLADLQREHFRLVPADQREAKLAEWLRDAQVEVRQAAMSIIRSRISEDGYRATGDVLAALLELLGSDPPGLRREALRIVQNNVTDPSVARAVLARLDVEQDTVTRQAVLLALGRLGDVTAIPLLVREIESPSAREVCVREAALALGQLSGRTDGEHGAGDAVAALKRRYASIPAEDTAYRADLLTAMAGVGDASFVAEFQAAVDSDDARLLHPAVRGLATIGDRSRMARLRVLLGYGDEVVRVAAIDAVGRLGRDDEDLGGLLQRMNPAIEPSAVAREAAWGAFRALAGLRPVDKQIAWAARLRDFPGRELAYLLALEDTVAGRSGATADREAVRDAAAAALVADGQHVEAATRLREIYAARTARGDATAFETGLRLLAAELRSPPAGRLAALVDALARAAPDDAGRARVVETVGAYLDADGDTAAVDRVRAVLAELRGVDGGPLGGRWTALLARVSARLDAADEEVAPEAAPGP
ncbi:MAG: HEAT repeat domain-containing protein, partial [Phycisphaerae bacterium]